MQPSDQVDYISQQIVRGLVREEYITADRHDPLIDAIAHVLVEDLEAEDRLNDEVRDMLKNFADEISRGSLNYQELFRKAKAKLAKERKMII